MNNEFYQVPNYLYQNGQKTPNQQTAPNYSQVNNFSSEQSYIENIIRLNKGKMAHLYFSYPDSDQWKNKIFDGIIEEAGRDHIIVSDPTTGKWYMLLMIYLNYIIFDDEINYNPKFGVNNPK